MSMWGLQAPMQVGWGEMGLCGRAGGGAVSAPFPDHPPPIPFRAPVTGTPEGVGPSGGRGCDLIKKQTNANQR